MTFISFYLHTDEGIRDFEIYLSIISNDVIWMLLFPHIFKWFFGIYIYVEREREFPFFIRVKFNMGPSGWSSDFLQILTSFWYPWETKFLKILAW